jgi:SpoVK/Ycf46/Vps4 family AAA+-type ATPase
MNIPKDWQQFVHALEDHIGGAPAAPTGDIAIPRSAEVMARELGLDTQELAYLVLACAPAMSTRIRELAPPPKGVRRIGALDVMTCIALAGANPMDIEARRPLREDAPLRALGLIRLEPKGAPLAGQVISVPDRVVGALLGDEWPDPPVVQSVHVPTREALAADMLPALPPIERATVVMRAAAGTAATDQARRVALDLFDSEPLVIDAHRLAADSGDGDSLRACVTEAALRQAPLVVDARTLDSDVSVSMARQLIPVMLPTIILAPAHTRIASDDEIQVIDLPAPTTSQRAMWWELFGSQLGATEATETTHVEPEDIVQLQGRSMTDVMIERFSSQTRDSKVRAIRPEFNLSDVIVDTSTKDSLRHLCDRVRYRTLVLDEWNMRPGGAKGRGVSALFAGPPGTGKTLAAEALAGELDLPLFCIELASVVDKYIGETEKNLERVFSAVERVDGILLFDEADALFGKRSEVSDARDRYANIEVAYLLQRIEAFDGLAILATNLRANLDEAFQRRLDMILDFPEPDVTARREMWSRALTGFPEALSKEDLDTIALIDITGGYIRAAAIDAAYFAAAEGVKVDRRHVLAGIKTEWRKSGRINFPEDHFAGW